MSTFLQQKLYFVNSERSICQKWQSSGYQGFQNEPTLTPYAQLYKRMIAKIFHVSST